MFKSRSEGNVVYKCSIRLLDDSFLELEFQVEFFALLCIPIRSQMQMRGKFTSRRSKTYIIEWKLFSLQEFPVFGRKFLKFNWLFSILLVTRKWRFCPKIIVTRATIFHCHSTIFFRSTSNLIVRVKFTTFQRILCCASRMTTF